MALAAALMVLLAHAWLYGAWINDDAGISFTYARNLAEGHGLVLNPGGERVEGYSNPLWVFLLAALIKGGLFHPVYAPKLLAIALVAATFYPLARLSGRLFGWPASIVHAVPALLLACSVPFVSWSVSGLENPLFIFLLVLALHLHLRETDDPSRFPWSALPLFLLAITRPEGALYAGAAFGHRLLLAPFRRRLLRHAAIGMLLFALLLAGYHAWHYAYFADLLPNTYYAKMQGGREVVPRLEKEVYNLDSTGWKYVRGAFADYRLGWVLAPGLILTLGRFRGRRAAILLVALVCGLNLFYALYVGGDWMDQYRFLGPTFVGAALMAAGCVTFVRLERDPSLHDPAAAGTPAEMSTPAGGGPGPHPSKRRFAVPKRSIPMTSDRQARRIATGVLQAAVFLAAAWALAAPNLWILEAVHAPPSVSFATVAERGRAFADLAREIGIQDASLMDPDLGGTSWASGLRMIDMGGLADAHIARYRYDPRFFIPYVLEERRPTFVRTHCVWSRDTGLNENEAFRRDYIPLWERPCPLECCREQLDGEYVRRDLFVAPAGATVPPVREVAFGSRLALVAWDLDRTLASPGDGLTLRMWWRPKERLPGESTFTIALEGPGGRGRSEQIDPGRGIHPPGRWVPGEIVHERRRVTVPPDAERGTHRLVLAVSGEGIGGSAALEAIEVDERRVREEAQELHRLHERAVAGGDFDGALTYLEREILLAGASPALDEQIESAREDYAAGRAEMGRSLLGEGRVDEAADLLLEAARRVGRRDGISVLLRELAGTYRDSAVFLLGRPGSFLHWSDALASLKRALECDPADSTSLMLLERSRGREHVLRAWGDAINAAHVAGADGPPVSPLLEAIQDDGFADEALEIVASSDGIRARLESERDLGALSLLHGAFLLAGDGAAAASIEARVSDLDPPMIRLGGKLIWLGTEIEPLEDGRTRISFFFRVIESMRINYRMFLHGYVKDRAILPEDRKEFEFANFDHEVLPPTSRWKEGSITRHTWTGRIPAGEYRFLFGLFRSKAGLFNNKTVKLAVEGKESAAVEIGWRTIPGNPGS